MLVAHYDFLSALLDALIVVGATGPFLNWRHFNTAVTVVDVALTGQVTTMATNMIGHLQDRPSLISGFDL